jgi:hypothetical protein
MFADSAFARSVARVSIRSARPVARRGARRAAVGLVAALAALWASGGSTAESQTLSGTYIRTLNTSRGGSLIRGTASVSYSETGGAGCDAFGWGSPIEGFTVTGTRGSTPFSILADSDTATAWIASSPPAVPPTVAGRVLSTSATDAATGLHVYQEATFESLDRAVRLRVTLTNNGTSALTNLYYVRGADPDQDSCADGTSSTETRNDVASPARGVLVTAAPPSGSSVYTVGLGSFDARARATVSSTFAIPSGSSSWSAPRDPNGLLEDVMIAVAFNVGTLNVGAATTLEMFYVFGTSTASVQSRFETLSPAPACTGEGSSCTAGGLTGRCHGGSCCTGCWDATAGRCETGGTASACGTRGLGCTRCDDGNPCTTDTCSAGACASSPVPSGAACDDGNACTAEDRCSGGVCAGSPRSCDDGYPCTADACDPVVGCRSNVTSGCLIDFSCVAAGTPNPSNPCLGCVPTSSREAWSPLPAGASCGTAACLGGTLFAAPTCDGRGTCVDGASSPCGGGACTPDGTRCADAPPPVDMGVGPGEDGGVTPGEDGGMPPIGDGGGGGADGGGTPPISGGGGRRGGGCAVATGAPSPEAGGAPWLALGAGLGACCAGLGAARRRGARRRNAR